jgi:hypothetical protein
VERDCQNCRAVSPSLQTVMCDDIASSYRRGIYSMNAIKNNYDQPNHLILSDRVYELDFSAASSSSRAFNRGLIDYSVEGVNPLNTRDRWHTLVGMSEELGADYSGFRVDIPLRWLLFRFLCHHVRTNSIHILSGLGGDVLTTATFQNYVGDTPEAKQAEDILRTGLLSWVRTLPEQEVKLVDLFVSTDLSLDTLQRAINALIFQNDLEKVDDNRFIVKPSIFQTIDQTIRPVSLDRKSNRYYQEIQIQTVEPFCFVLMPFREEEFQQAIYFDVIKPFIENEFNILCYRVDEDDLPDRIDNKIYTYILRAAFVVAEVTTRNPNVFYELGLAHMLEKYCIILTQTPHSEVPFDINRISSEPYNNEDELRSCLRKSISALAFKAIS